MGVPSGGPIILAWRVQIQTGNWALGTNPGFLWVFLGQTQDFYVGFQNRARIFIMELEANRGLMSVPTPTWMHLGQPQEVPHNLTYKVDWSVIEFE